MPNPYGSKDIPVLNGIRALAVTIVFASHASNIYFEGVLTGLGGGQLGVMLFFMLSGFLMAFLYLDKPATWRIQYGFLVNRFARVYPMFVVIVVACYMANVKGLNLLVYPILTRRELLEHLAFVRGYNVLWTIGPEVIFYLLFLALWNAGRFGKGSLLVVAIVMATFAWLPIKTSGANSLDALHDRLPYFLVGMSMGMIPKRFLGSNFNGRAITQLAFWASLVVFVASFPQILRHLVNLPTAFLAAPWAETWSHPFYLLVTVALFASALISQPKILTNGVAGFIGKISFSLYLLHFMVLDNMRRLMPAHPLGAVALSAFVTILLSSLTYATIEMPMRSLIRRLGRRYSKNEALMPSAS